MTTPRERARAQTMADITRIGREHLVQHGTAALSLRAVARDLGVVSSAVYRYVRNRDELLTLLVVDGYTEMADEVDAAVAREPGDEYLMRFRAIGLAVRAWALREPARYGLLYGTPVPGYAAPPEQTVPAGTRVVAALVDVLERAWVAGALVAPDTTTAPPALAPSFAAIRDEFGLTLPDDLLARGVFAWAALFGAVSFEVFDQYGADTFADAAALFDHHLDVLAESLGLRRA